MNYSSLEDAFGAPGQGGITEAGKQARKEERRKAKRCKGPPMEFLGLKDPDRQNLDKAPNVPAMNPRIGLREHVPVDAPDGSLEPFTVPGQTKNSGPVGSFEDNLADQRKYEFTEQRTDGDEEGDEVRNTLPSPKQIMGVMASEGGSYFGKDPTADEPFSDYRPDAKNYLMEPSFVSAFNQSLPGGGRAGANAAAVLPIPSVRDVWKPITPGGANTSFFQKLPRPGGTYPVADGQSQQSLSRKIDTIMERLDLMNRGPSPEQNQTDILLFVSSGIFVLFMMDLLVRKGSSMKFL